MKLLMVEFYDFTTHRGWEGEQHDADKEMVKCWAVGWERPSKEHLVLATVMTSSKKYNHQHIIPKGAIIKITELNCQNDFEVVREE